MRDILLFIGAAFFEIFGCFTFWLYFRLHKSVLWLIPGLVSLILFALLLSQIKVDFAGRTYAIYGGIYIVASIVWLYAVEHKTPDAWDIIGGGICILGAMIIFLMPR
ncbi:MAG: YnfA family protein [Bacteroidota bacterium]